MKLCAESIREIREADASAKLGILARGPYWLYNSAEMLASEKLRYIKHNLKLKKSELARIFRVSRLTIVSWMDGGAVKLERSKKLSRIADLVDRAMPVLGGRKEAFANRALEGKMNLVDLLAVDRYEAIELLRLELEKGRPGDPYGRIK